MPFKLARLLALVLVALAGLAITSFASVGATPSEDTKEIVVEARQFSYTPGTIRATQGQRVRLTLRAMDVTHGLYLDAFGLEVKAVPGSPQQLEFVADRAGQFSFRCTQTCGRLHPFMVGKLIVSPNLPFNTSLLLAALLSVAVPGYLWLRDRRLLVPVPKGSASSWITTSKSSESAPKHFQGENVSEQDSATRPAGIYLDFLQFPTIGPFLRWRGFQFACMLPFLFFFTLALVAGLRGSPIGSHNFGIVFVWVVWWALLIILLIPLGGRLWCAVCPVPGPGEWLQRLSFIRKREGRLFTLGKRWPPQLRNLWLQNGAFLIVAVFSAVVFTTPAATAAVLAAFLVLSLAMSLVFLGRTFCRYVCPLGGFIGLCSLVAPLAVRVRDREVCRAHKQKECIEGGAQGYGCPWFEYPGAMKRNVHCGLCMECVKTCSKGNIAVGLQPIGRDLTVADGRVDEAYRVFIALASAALYSAVMLGPWGGLKSLASNPLMWGFAIYAAILAGTSLVVVPGLFLAVAWLSRLASGARRVSVIRLWKNFSYGLVPLALMAWVAFSLSLVLVGGSYVVPTVSDPLGRGWNIFGTAAFEGAPVLMESLPYLQIAALLVGLAWSIETGWQIARKNFASRQKALRGLAPIVVFTFGATTVYLWLYIG